MVDPLPSPSGWFAIGVSEDFPSEQAVPGHWFDQDLVVFRSADGTLGALDAYCPHLGAHLGYGGTVNGGFITCPFHGWQWAPDGTCISVPYGNRRVPKVRAQSVSIIEQDGVVLLWRGADGLPTWVRKLSRQPGAIREAAASVDRRSERVSASIRTRRAACVQKTSSAARKSYCGGNGAESP